MDGFTPERRARLLAFIEAGWTTEAACAAASVSRTTVNRWAALGRADATPESAAFTQQLARARAEAGDAVVAEREADRVPTFGDPDYLDGMTFLEPDRMAALTDELRQRARKLFVTGLDAQGGPGWQSGRQWKRERRAILRGERDCQPQASG
jgi:hypothetical protein